MHIRRKVRGKRDDFALWISSGITRSSQHDNRRISVFQFHRLRAKRPGGTGIHQVDGIRLAQRQKNLTLRVPKTNIELQNLRAALSQHQPDIKRSPIVDSIPPKAFQGWLDDDLANGLQQRFVHDCGRSVSAHPAGVGSGIAFADALVILAHWQADIVVAADHHHNGGFFSIEKFFNHHLGTCLAEDRIVEHRLDARNGVFPGFADKDPFSSRQTTGFHHHRQTATVEVLNGR